MQTMSTQLAEESETTDVSIWLIKATRAPVLAIRVRSSMGLETATEVALLVSRMQRGGLAPSGISIQIVDSKYDSLIRKIEIGDLKFQGIPVIHQINGV